jgi:excisionase family DNA binding protein
MSNTSSAPADLLSLNEAAETLGVHYMTAYRYVRLGMLPATQEGRAWKVRSDDLDAFMADGGEAKPAKRGEANWTERLYNRMLAGDEAGAWGVVEAAMASGMTGPSVYQEVLVPALKEVGDKWVAGDIDVADEHTASRVADRVVSRLGAKVQPRGVRRGTIVLGSTQTDLHGLPLSIAADLFRAARFTVIDLGANLPPASFAKAVRDADNVVAIAVGVTMLDQEDQIAETIQALRAVSDAPVILGGGGSSPELAKRTGADAHAPKAEDAIAEFESILAAK